MNRIMPIMEEIIIIDKVLIIDKTTIETTMTSQLSIS